MSSCEGEEAPPKRQRQLDQAGKGKPQQLAKAGKDKGTSQGQHSEASESKDMVLGAPLANTASQPLVVASQPQAAQSHPSIISVLTPSATHSSASQPPPPKIQQQPPVKIHSQSPPKTQQPPPKIPQQSKARTHPQSQTKIYQQSKPGILPQPPVVHQGLPVVHQGLPVAQQGLPVAQEVSAVEGEGLPGMGRVQRYLLTVEYVGSHFSGFQRQTTARTVQGALEDALLHMLGEKPKLQTEQPKDNHQQTKQRKHPQQQQQYKKFIHSEKGPLSQNQQNAYQQNLMMGLPLEMSGQWDQQQSVKMQSDEQQNSVTPQRQSHETPQSNSVTTSLETTKETAIETTKETAKETAIETTKETAKEAAIETETCDGIGALQAATPLADPSTVPIGSTSEGMGSANGNGAGVKRPPKINEIVGSSRTDAGVHALGNTCHVDILRRSKRKHGQIAEPFSPKQLMKGLNHFLSFGGDAAVVDVKAVDDTFHARHSATERTYFYRVHASPTTPPSIFERNLVWHVPAHLDLDAMKEACQVLQGHHDFSSFRASGCQALSPMRTLSELSIHSSEWWSPPRPTFQGLHCTTSSITQNEENEDPQRLVIVARGPSFLYHQVRLLVGTLKAVGCGDKSVEDVERILKACDIAVTPSMAPAQGLYLAAVSYEVAKEPNIISPTP